MSHSGEWPPAAIWEVAGRERAMVREDDKILVVSQRLTAPPLDTCQRRLVSEPWSFLQTLFPVWFV